VVKASEQFSFLIVQSEAKVVTWLCVTSCCLATPAENVFFFRGGGGEDFLRVFEGGGGHQNKRRN